MKIILILLFGLLSQVAVAQKPYMSVQDRLDAIDSILALNQTINGKVLTDSLILTADDILGLDDSFIDPHDFQIGQYIKVDTVGGDTVFVADAGGSEDPDTTKRIVVLIQDTAVTQPGEVLYFKELYNNTIETTIAQITLRDGVGWYGMVLTSEYLRDRTPRSSPVLNYLYDPSTDPMYLQATVVAFPSTADDEINVRSVDDSYTDAVFPAQPVILTIYFIHD